MAHFTVGEEIWIEASEDLKKVYETATILTITASLLTTKVKSSGAIKSLSREKGFKINSSSTEDMTSLRNIHDIGILHNLEVRSYSDSPYTAIGPVLIVVNPLQATPDPNKSLGKAVASKFAHPYGTSETAFQQMCFGISQNKRQNNESIVNQSIVIGGESGSGKTYAAKMVLAHLVKRCDVSIESLDSKLINTNPILEAFGNASTSRNYNSSRFGKFMKINFNAKTQISSAVIETYLLERSRVTSHLLNERNYHVFYQLLASPLPKQQAHLKLQNAKSFRYLNKARASIVVKDGKNFVELAECLTSIGVAGAKQLAVFEVVAGILHLGNITFVNDDADAHGDAAVLSNDSAKVALSNTAALLRLHEDKLLEMLTKRRIKVNSEVMQAARNADSAVYAADAVAKSLYSRLFDWLLVQINLTIVGQQERERSFIGILDIFGFETFERNDFEQLLINYTNEALQHTFNQSVFDAEAGLLRAEGILDDAALSKIAMPSNDTCVRLLRGYDRAHPGILALIDSEGRVPQSTDTKLLSMLNSQFSKGKNRNECYLLPHPSRRHECFAVRHYASEVTYTVGHFLDKNIDSLPGEVDECLLTSGSHLLKEVWSSSTHGLDATDKLLQDVGRVKQKPKSIVAKFNAQITSLVAELDATKVVFIRCVKPNPQNQRSKGKNDWFLRPYVVQQLVSLSVPQTVMVLRNGLPTRLTYATLYTSYAKALPAKVVQAYRFEDEASKRKFIAALFYAFEIERSKYKLGLTRAFFQAGVVDQLDARLAAGAGGKDVKKLGAQFQQYYVRALWRRCFALVLAVNRFNRSLLAARRKRAELETECAVSIQRVQRGRRARVLASQLRADRLAKEEADVLAKEAADRRAKEEADRRAEEEAGADRLAKQKAMEAVAKQAASAEAVALMEKQAAAEEAKEVKEAARMSAKAAKENKAANVSAKEKVFVNGTKSPSYSDFEPLLPMSKGDWMQPVTCWGTKQARRSRRNWKRRFFVLDREACTIAYFAKADAADRQGVGKPKKVYSFSKALAGDDLSKRCKLLALQEPVGNRSCNNPLLHEHVLKITDARSGDLLISFDDEESRERFRFALSQAILGYQHSHLAATKEDMQHTRRERRRSSHLLDAQDVTTFNGADLTLEARESMEALRQLHSQGTISADDLQRGNAAVLEAMRISAQGEDAVEASQEANHYLVTCRNCLMLNNADETAYCVGCDTHLPTPLISPRAPDADRAYSSQHGKPLSEKDYHGGTLRLWLKGSEKHHGFKSRVYWRLLFEFSSAHTEPVSWFAKVLYEDLEQLRSRMLKSYTFPADAKEVLPSLMHTGHKPAAQEQAITAFLAQLFDSIAVTLLVHCDETEYLFLIQQHIHVKEDSDETFVLHEEFYGYEDLQGAAEASARQPLNYHEMDLMEANVVAFKILLLQHGAHSLQIDPRIHQIALTLQDLEPRIFASLDFDNKLCHLDLMERAYQLADDVKEVTRLYQEGLEAVNADLE